MLTALVVESHTSAAYSRRGLQRVLYARILTFFGAFPSVNLINRNNLYAFEITFSYMLILFQTC